MKSEFVTAITQLAAEKGVPESEADARLVALIQREGKWVDAN